MIHNWRSRKTRLLFLNCFKYHPIVFVINRLRHFVWQLSSHWHYDITAIFLKDSNSRLDDSRSSAWSGALPKTLWTSQGPKNGKLLIQKYCHIVNVRKSNENSFFSKFWNKNSPSFINLFFLPGATALLKGLRLSLYNIFSIVQLFSFHFLKLFLTLLWLYGFWLVGYIYSRGYI